MLKMYYSGYFTATESLRDSAFSATRDSCASATRPTLAKVADLHHKISFFNTKLVNFV